MKRLLRSLIRVYWMVWPRHLNRGCVYRETCSHHVHRITGEQGFIAGCRAFLIRYHTCRPGYMASSSLNGELGLVLCEGTFIPEHLVAKDIMAPIHATLRSMEQRFSEFNKAPLPERRMA